MFNFYKKQFLSFDISDHSIELFSLKGFLKSSKITVMDRILLEEGIVENGKILDEEKLKSCIQKLIKNPAFGKIKTKKIIFSIPESNTLFYNFFLPEDIKKGDEFDLIKKEAEQTFPYLLKDLYFDFKINNKEVFLFAVSKKIVDDFLRIFKDCSLEPVIFEPASESLFRSLVKGQKEPILIVDIGEKTADFSFFNKGFLKINISIETAGKKFTRSISEGLEVSFEEAKTLKEKFGLSPEKKEGKIFLILQKETREIINEIIKIEDYFKNKEGENLKKIILTGGSAILPYFSEYLAENLQKPVVVGDPFEGINTKDLPKKKIFKNKAVIYSIVAGSALRGLAKNPEKSGINLIKEIKNKDFKKRQDYNIVFSSPKSFNRDLSKKKILIWLAIGILISISAIFIIKFMPEFFNSKEIKIENKENLELFQEESINPDFNQETQNNLKEIFESSEEEKEDEINQETVNFELIINDTPTGWLNVRDQASFEGMVVSKVYPGEEYEYISEKDGWYKIILKDKTEGWIFGGYVKKD